MDDSSHGGAPGDRQVPLRLPEHRRGVRDLYLAVFSEPPWGEGADEADGFAERLDAEVAAGARGLVLLDGERVVGLAYAVPTPAPFPTGRSYGRVARVCEARLLEGTWEVMEVAVHPDARGGGRARRLLDALLLDCSPAWLLTSTEALAAQRFYDRQPGLVRLGTGEGLVVYGTT
ncbi:GNAT family N-acetyltransferase [Phycicoccus avicenniae]|uniref:GNAT family N-acetyltransferase n=1 Tax=Phycicoccus avicenniae TaxID=2828860 RepID=UPI003D2CDA8E